MRRTWLLLLGGLFIHTLAFAQEGEVDLFELSLEELMNVEIISASKKTENLFDAPVSSYSITYEEIEKSGVTSIPEALRLCPGVIVREMTNGNYDIHLRGFDNISRYGNRGSQVNIQTLLMIDNRPVFNYTYGGIFWEALPIDLIDVERIEVVRGPSAPLFGPNAVTGVINIITREAQKEGWYQRANVQYGTPRSMIGNLALGKHFKGKTSLIFSGNYQNRTRHDNLYYTFDSDQYLENVADLPDAAVLYPEPALALDKYGINAFFDHQVNDHVQVNFSAGVHHAETQKNFVNSLTALGFNNTRSQYINLGAQIHGINTKFSYTRSHDQFTYDDTANIALEFDGMVADFVIDYQWQATSKLQLRPAVNYQRATYNDLPYVEAAVFGGLFNRTVTISGIAASLRGDYQFTDAWRIIGSARVDKFARPDDIYLSYQFASTYTWADRYLFRVAYAKSNSSAFAINTSTELIADIDLELAGPGTGPMLRQSYLGKPDLELTNVTMAEIGIRTKFTDRFRVDVDAFRQQLEDLNMFVVSEQTFQPSGYPDPAPPVVPATTVTKIENLPTRAVQYGVTLSANFVPSSRLQLKPFITLQKTVVKELPLSYNALPLDDSNPYNIYNGISQEHFSTPRIYGGAFIHGAITPKLQANLNGYYFGAHTQYTSNDANTDKNSAAGSINSKLLLNTKLYYQVMSPFKVYTNVRNLLGNDSREYYGTDRIGRSYWVGASYNF